MSGVAPPPGPPPGTGTAAAAATPAAAHAVPATLADVPPAVRQLGAGTVLQGLALGADARGRLLVRTDLGVLALATRLQVPRGAGVTVQLRSAGAQLHALVMQVQDPSAGGTAPRPAAAPGGQGVASTARPDGQGAASTARPGGSGDGPAPAPRPGATRAAPTRAAPAAAAPADVLARGRPLKAVVQAPAPGAQALLPGREVQLRVLEVRAGPTPAPAPAAPAGEAAARPFAATVVGADAAGRPLLQTPLGTLQLAARAALPTGTALLVELVRPAPELPAPATPAPARAAEPAALLRAWPALQEAVEALRAESSPPAAPGPAESPLSALPQPGSRLASAVLFFLAALRGGDLAGWLGNEATRALERAGRGDLAARLGQDLGRMARLADEAGGPDWRLVPLPLFAEGEVRLVRLFLRRRGGGDGGADAEAGDEATRFVVELELSRLGELQLDGLVRAERFDLVLRSRRPLAATMRADIAGIFEAANAAAGAAGQLRFQASAEWTAMPLEAPSAGGLVV